MRDRLIDIIADKLGSINCAKLIAADIADHLLAEGVILPKVKIGDKLYAINASQTRVNPYIVTRLEVYESGVKISARPIYCRQEYWMCWEAELGNNDCVFLTREEAEKALERSENG